MKNMIFRRRIWSRYSKLGKGRRKKQKWRKPKGRDNKMREKRRGYSAVVSIGYKKRESDRLKPIIVRNLNDLSKVEKKQTIIIGKVGRKKKIEIVKKAKEMKLSLQNVNVEKFLNKFLEKKNKGEISNESK